MDAVLASDSTRKAMESAGPARDPAAPAPMIMGREETVIDEKGRIRLPKKMQDALGDDFVLWVHPDGYIVAFPKRRWEAVIAQITSRRPDGDPEREKLLEIYAPFAEGDISVDSQGRFVLPRRIRQLAKFETNEIVLKGAIDVLQIWTLEADRQATLSPEERKRRRQEFYEKTSRSERGD